MADIDVPNEVQTLLYDTSSKKLHLTAFPTPTPTPSQVLIKVHATSFTRDELTWPEPNGIADPIPGRDFAGTVLASGRGSRFRRGDRVYGLTSFGRQGHARGISVAEEAEIARAPANLGFREAAAVPMGALSAWQALFVHAGLDALRRDENRGKRLLITGAAGGVGSWAVQFASWAGVGEVVAVAKSASAEFVKGLGADVVVAYDQVGLAEWVAGDDGKLFDAVFDCVGGKTLEEAWTVAKPFGTVVSIGEPPDARKPKERVRKGVKGIWFIVEPDGNMMSQITDLLEKGSVKPIVDSAWPLQEWQRAFDKAQNGRPKGKVVLMLEE